MSAVDDAEEEDASLISSGVEQVTVPAGTFTTTKYTMKTTDGEDPWWISSNVPIPVKFAGTSGNTSHTIELVSWK